MNRRCGAVAGRRRGVGSLLAAGAVVALVGACAPAPPVHPLGAACTWPASVDLQRDGLAVLEDPTSSLAVVLLEVATGRVRARCVGVGYAGFEPQFQLADGTTGRPARNPATVVGSPLDPDLRHVVVPAGVMDLHTGAVVPNPDAGWPASKLPGGGAVLRGRALDPPQEESHDHGRWCVAPRAEAPQALCRPLPGAGPGSPVSHGDGSVGWAPGLPVPAEFSGVRGWVQTDGERILQARLSESIDGDGTGSAIDGSGRAGLFSRSETLLGLGLARFDHPTWFTLDTVSASSVRATLHRSAVTWSLIGLTTQVVPFGAAVIDGGRALVVVLVDREGSEGVLVRVEESGSVRELFRIPFGEGPLDFGRAPRILAWPDSNPSGGV